MIASPSDVIEQRNDVRVILSDWNFENGFSRKVVLMPVGWETHAAPDLAGRAQSIINDRLLNDCDLLIGIFWTKLGTPTGDFASGTVEEITRHVDAGRPAMIYFSDAPVAPQLLDAEEYEKVKSFKAWCYEKGLVASFSNPDEFRRSFRSQLQINLNSNPYLKAIIDNNQEIAPDLNAPEISDNAQVLLNECAEDPYGQLMVLDSFDGRHIQTHGKSFGDPGNPRSSAKWDAALEELVKLRYLAKSDNGQVYKVTDAGYRCVDRFMSVPDA